MAEGIFSEQQLATLLESYKKKLENLNIPIQKIYLYGSYAKGTPHVDSDVDICVISPAFNDRIESTITLMKLRDDSELYISPVAFSPDSFVEENPLAWEVKMTGREV